MAPPWKGYVVSKSPLCQSGAGRGRSSYSAGTRRRRPLLEPPLNLFDLSGRTALLTGSSKGIGFALATALGRAGARIVLNARDAAALAAARDALRAKGIAAEAMAFDVTDAAAVE